MVTVVAVPTVMVGQVGAGPDAGAAVTLEADAQGFAQLLEGLEVQPLGTTAAVLPKTVKAIVADADDTPVPDMLALCNVMLPPVALPVNAGASIATPPAMTAAPLDAAAPTTGSLPVVGDTTLLEANSSITPTETMITTLGNVPRAPSPEVKPSTMMPAATEPSAQTSDASKPALATPLPLAETLSSDVAPPAINSADVQWLHAMTPKPKLEIKAAPQTTSALADAEVDGASQVSSNHDSGLAALQPSLSPMLQKLSKDTSMSISAPLPRKPEAEPAEVKTAQPITAPVYASVTDSQPAISEPVKHQLHAAVGTHQWVNELGNKLTLLARDTQAATLHVTPDELGPVQVRIEVNQGQTSVWFTAEHADTRSALEQSLPRLRDMFAAQGMSLTDAGVFGNHAGRQFTGENAPRSNFQNLNFVDDSIADTAAVRSLSLGLLDAYA